MAIRRLARPSDQEREVIMQGRSAFTLGTWGVLKDIDVPDAFAYIESKLASVIPQLDAMGLDGTKMSEIHDGIKQIVSIVSKIYPMADDIQDAIDQVQLENNLY